jgi:hypothetical protein
MQNCLAEGTQNFFSCELMDRTLWQQHLAKADRHVIDGQQHIARQRKITPSLSATGTMRNLRVIFWPNSNPFKHYTLPIVIASAQSWVCSGGVRPRPLYFDQLPTLHSQTDQVQNDQ